MKAVIVGCGRVGAGIADELDRTGWQVLIIDLTTAAFDRLPVTFGGVARRGDGTDEDTLRQSGAEDADLFLAMTEGDNRNVMAAQLAIESLGARRCVAKINDPVRAAAYAHLGIAALCRTNLMTASVLEYVGQAPPDHPGIYPPSQQHPHARNGDLAGAMSSDGAAAGAASEGSASDGDAAEPVHGDSADAGSFGASPVAGGTTGPETGPAAGATASEA